MAKGTLVMHNQTQHGLAKWGLGTEGNEASRGNEPRTYRMAFPVKVIPRPCPVKGCSGWASTCTAMLEEYLNSNSISTWERKGGEIPKPKH